ncbi:MAG TPA: hypothetical protein VGJ00_03380 [Rhabdochlamydiaceae bacterium]|jgi:hypothetical protein
MSRVLAKDDCDNPDALKQIAICLQREAQHVPLNKIPLAVWSCAFLKIERKYIILRKFSNRICEPPIKDIYDEADLGRIAYSFAKANFDEGNNGLYKKISEAALPKIKTFSQQHLYTLLTAFGSLRFYDIQLFTAAAKRIGEFENFDSNLLPLYY